MTSTFHGWLHIILINRHVITVITSVRLYKPFYEAVGISHNCRNVFVKSEFQGDSLYSNENRTIRINRLTRTGWYFGRCRVDYAFMIGESSYTIWFETGKKINEDYNCTEEISYNIHMWSLISRTLAFWTPTLHVKPDTYPLCEVWYEQYINSSPGYLIFFWSLYYI